MQELTSFSEFESSLKNQSWLLVNVGTSSCEPCYLLSPVVKKIAVHFKKLIGTVYIDAEEIPEIPSMYQLKSVPTLLLIHNGKVVEGTEGAQTYDQVSRWLMKHILVF